MTRPMSVRSQVEPFLAMDVLSAANRLKKQGKPVISMAVGQPGDPAPLAVRHAAERALHDGRIGYTDALGLIELREAIANHYGSHYGVQIDPQRITVTTGSSAAFNLAFLAMFDPGDRVAITAPGYPAYRNIMKALGLEVVEIPLDIDGYLKAGQVRDLHQERPLSGILFASPANPTGTVIPEAELKALCDTAHELNISLISDEIYHRLNFNGADITALAMDDEITVINSFSKYYCMTGWRVGWMVLPPKMVRSVECLAQSMYISAPELSQIAAIEAFGASNELDLIKARYAENRNLLSTAMPRLGMPLAAPLDGAFYAYCDVSRFSNDSLTFARRMLEETLVAATPGLDFDPVQGSRFMRFSYAGKTEDMIEAMRRLQEWLPAC